MKNIDLDLLYQCDFIVNCETGKVIKNKVFPKIKVEKKGKYIIITEDK